MKTLYKNKKNFQSKLFQIAVGCNLSVCILQWKLLQKIEHCQQYIKWKN